MNHTVNLGTPKHRLRHWSQAITRLLAISSAVNHLSRVEVAP
jgi:hypothetical protein